MSDAWDAIAGAMMSWHQAKLFVEHGLAISHDALHVLAGMLLWLLAALLLRRPISAWLPWLWLAALTAFNEAVDLWTDQWPDAGMQYGEGAKDLALTIFLPSLLMIAARRRPALFRQEQRAGRARTRK